MELQNLNNEQLLQVGRRLTEDLRKLGKPTEPWALKKAKQIGRALKSLNDEMDRRTGTISAEQRSKILDSIVAELP